VLAGGILQLDVSKIPNKSEELSAAIRVTVNNGAEVELEQQTVLNLRSAGDPVHGCPEPGRLGQVGR
jgi:hypothetical protein